MASPLRAWRVIVAFLLCVATSLQGRGQDDQSKKSWQFHGRSGDVEISVISSPGTNGVTVSSLHISSNGGVVRSAFEESGFLQQVLDDDLPKQGLNARSLSWIGLRLNERDARLRLAEYAARSSTWRPAVKTRNVAKVYPLIVSFLNRSGAYKDWDQVFNRYGLTLKVVGVEEVEMEGFSKLGIQCPSGVNCENLLVPSDAFIQINIIPITQR